MSQTRTHTGHTGHAHTHTGHACERGAARPRRRHALLAAALLAALCGTASLGCQENPSTPATTSTAAPTSAAPSSPAAGPRESLPLNADASRVGFTGRKITGSHDGGFARFSGTLELVEGRPEGGTVSVDVDVSSLAIEPERLRGHLLSADFFDVTRFPRATFVSTAVTAGAAAPATHTVTGNLTLHGVTRSVSFPATFRVSATEVEATADFSIDRREFGVVYPGMPDDLIQDAVSLRLSLRAPRRT
jgi:polyisoprenoid-binding protein YceI